MKAWRACSNAVLRRWMKFNFVGAMGIGVQLLAVYVCGALLQANSLLATGLGVEAAVLHNFLWHEHFTWADRRCDARQNRGFWLRLLAFNGSAGAISIGGNLFLVWLMISQARIPILPANLVAIACCSILNFTTNDKLIFHGKESAHGGVKRSAKSHSISAA